MRTHHGANSCPPLPPHLKQPSTKTASLKSPSWWRLPLFFADASLSNQSHFNHLYTRVLDRNSWMSLPDLCAASAQNSNHKSVIKLDFNKPADGGVVNEAKTNLSPTIFNCWLFFCSCQSLFCVLLSVEKGDKIGTSVPSALLPTISGWAPKWNLLLLLLKR